MVFNSRLIAYTCVYFAITLVQEVFNYAVEVDVVRYIAAILDYIAADILKVHVHVHICSYYVHVKYICTSEAI